MNIGYAVHSPVRMCRDALNTIAWRGRLCRVARCGSEATSWPDYVGHAGLEVATDTKRAGSCLRHLLKDRS
jgi:hypothetical protein